MLTITQEGSTTQEGTTASETWSRIANGEVQWRKRQYRPGNLESDPDRVSFVHIPERHTSGLDAPEDQPDLCEIERHPEITAEIHSLQQFIRDGLAPAPIEFSIEHFTHQEDDDDAPIQLLNLVASAPPDVDDEKCAALSLEAIRRLARSPSMLVRRFLTVSVR